METGIKTTSLPDVELNFNNKLITEQLIEENRLVNLPRTIQKYYLLLDSKIKELRRKLPLYELYTDFWIPKIIKDGIITKIESTPGLRAKVISESELDVVIQIIDLQKRDNMFIDPEYDFYREKLIKKSYKKRRQYVKRVPAILARALVIDLCYFEGIEVMMSRIPESDNDKVDLLFVKRFW